VDAFAKNNETIPGKMVNGMRLMVPRIIINVDPMFNSLSKIMVDRLSQALSESGKLGFYTPIYSGQACPPNELEDIQTAKGLLAPCCDSQVRFHYVKSFNGDELSREYTEAIRFVQEVQCGLFIFVLGDDSLVLRNCPEHGVLVYECDFSMYDQSQGKKLQLLMLRMLTMTGVHSTLLDSWSKAIFSQTMTMSMENTKFTAYKRPMQMTGICTTSVCNSWLNIISTIYAHSSGYDLEEISERYSQLGLTAKLTRCGVDDGPVFLRGWFVPPNYCWRPLPSQCFKMGKTLDFTMPIKLIAYGAAKSVGNVEEDYPILGVMIRRMLAFGQQNVAVDSRQVTEANPYKIHSVCEDYQICSRDSVLALIERRYDLSTNDVLRIEEVIKRAPIPGAFSCREIYNLAKDY
jgi:hypothetical protein